MTEGEAESWMGEGGMTEGGGRNDGRGRRNDGRGRRKDVVGEGGMMRLPGECDAGFRLSPE